VLFERHWLSCYMFPRVLVSDLGTNFTCQTFQELLKEYFIRQETSASQHYMGHGKVEVRCKLVATTLRCILENDQSEWLSKLLAFVMAINSTCTTFSGLTPLEAFFIFINPRGIEPP